MMTSCLLLQTRLLQGKLTQQKHTMKKYDSEAEQVTYTVGTN